MSRNDVLITAAALRSRLSSVILLDVGGEDEGRTQGIAGAIPVNPATAFAGAAGGLRGNRPLPEIPVLQTQVRYWGVDNDSEIVLYDDKGNAQAARGWWTLRWAGLKNVRLLDGGLAAADTAGLPLAPLQRRAGNGTATLSAGHLPVLEAEAAAQYAREGRLLDARAAKAFNGDPQARTGGHIPGSINLPSSGNLDAKGYFLSDEALRKRFAGHEGAGVTCGSGVSAAHNAAALAILGQAAPLYVGSWSAWSADPARPVAYGAEAVV